MGIAFEKRLDSVTAHQSSREKFAAEVLENQVLFPEWIRLCFSFSNPKHAKACWILEMVCYKKPEWLQDHLDFFCANSCKLTDDSAIRAISKAHLLLSIAHFKKKSILLNETHLQQMTATCLDWLLQDNKVASKCYCIRTLHLLGHHLDWIHPELIIIVEKDYPHHSAAYKAVAREILKKIKGGK